MYASEKASNGYLGATLCHVSTPGDLDMRALGRRLKLRREELRMGQDDVARGAFVSRAYISRLERGLVPAPKVTELGQVAEALQTSLVELLRQPPGTRTERYSLECGELMDQLAGEPPEIVDAVLAAWRTSVQIARARRDGARN
jgi:transcriptional regulator with XRE-family HTH domain